MADIKAETDKLLQDLMDLGDDVKNDLWSEENKRFLQMIARDLAQLSAKILATNDGAKKKRYRRSIDLLQNHVMVMTFSRLNVAENEARSIIQRLLRRQLQQTVDAAMKRLGVDKE